MEEVSGITLTLIACISFIGSVLCSLAKSAQAHLSIPKFEGILESEREKRRFKNFLNKSTQIFIGLTIIETMANIIFVISIIFFFSKNGSIKNIDLLYGLIFSFLPLLIFAKSIPETLAKVRAEGIMYWLLPFSMFTYWLLCWITAPVYKLTLMFEKILEPPTITTSPDLIEKEILEVVNQGEKEGVLQQREKKMIEAIMELKNSEVKEIMTPRTDMFCISINTPIDEAVEKAIEKGHSRIPVYKENRDDIVGILYVKDILKYWKVEDRKDLNIEKIMREPFFIPETKHIGSLLRDFQIQKKHMAIVLDEYGGTAGIVTIEDIIEEIVGEILDEYDRDILEPIKFIDNNTVEIDARVHVDELNEKLNIDIPLDDGYETVGGFLFTSMGHIPQKDEKYIYNNTEFIVLDATPRRINRLKVIKKIKEEKKNT